MIRRIGPVAEEARDIILLMDGRGHICDANRAALSAYRYSLDEITKLNIRQLRSTQTRDEINDQMARAADAGVQFETTHLRRDGSEFPCEVSSRKVDLDGESFLVSVIRDLDGAPARRGDPARTGEPVRDRVPQQPRRRQHRQPRGRHLCRRQRQLPAHHGARAAGGDRQDLRAAGAPPRSAGRRALRARARDPLLRRVRGARARARRARARHHPLARVHRARRQAVRGRLRARHQRAQAARGAAAARAAHGGGRTARRRRRARLQQHPHRRARPLARSS